MSTLSWVIKNIKYEISNMSIYAHSPIPLFGILKVVIRQRACVFSENFDFS